MPTQIAAVADVPHRDTGAVSGIVGAAYQLGGALGLAALTALSTSHVQDLLASGAARTDALVAGYHRGLLLAALLALVNVGLALRAPRLRPTPALVAGAA